MSDRFKEKAATLLDQLTVATMNENYQDRDEDRRTLAEALHQAERDGALRVLEEVERVERTTCASSVTALREVRARITRGESP